MSLPALMESHEVRDLIIEALSGEIDPAEGVMLVPINNDENCSRLAMLRGHAGEVWLVTVQRGKVVGS